VEVNVIITERLELVGAIEQAQWSGYRSSTGEYVERVLAPIAGAERSDTPTVAVDPPLRRAALCGVLDDEMLMALPPDDVAKAIAGMEALAKNGFRYPFPQYGIQQDVCDGNNSGDNPRQHPPPPRRYCLFMPDLRVLPIGCVLLPPLFSSPEIVNDHIGSKPHNGRPPLLVRNLRLSRAFHCIAVRRS